MFDDLRQQANEADFEEEDDEFLSESQPRSSGLFLGMTPPQRFLIAVMLLMMTCILGSFFLLVTEKIALPF